MQDIDSLNPFELAQEIGNQLYGEIGKKAYGELELSFVSKLCPKYFEETKIRAFINLNFYWPRSYFKNTLIEDFNECLPNGFTNRKITSATTETMFGSITQDGSKIIKPLFWGYETCYLPELTAFLGTTDFKDKSNTFNEILEGNEVTRDLIKFGNATPELINEFTKSGDIRFDGRSLSYTPDTCFIIGTRPLDNKTYTYLDQSGFWSRFHTIQIKVTDQMATELFTGSFTPDNTNDVQEMKNRLSITNQKLFGDREKIQNHFNYEKVLGPALESANKLIVKKAELSNVNVSDLVNIRLKGDILREVNAYQVLTDESESNLLSWISSRLDHFFDFGFNPIIAKEVTTPKLNKTDTAFSKILEFTKGVKRTRQEIVDEMETHDISRSTVDRALNKINEQNLNKVDAEYGYYET